MIEVYVLKEILLSQVSPIGDNWRWKPKAERNYTLCLFPSLPPHWTQNHVRNITLNFEKGMSYLLFFIICFICTLPQIQSNYVCVII